MIACALRGRPSFPWLFKHQTSQSKNGNDAMRLFNLAHYQPMPTMARGRSAFHLKPLVAKNMQADPAHQPGATGERWSGHVSYKRVTKALQDAERACIRAWERKRTPDYCTLELQYAWRISLARAHLWTLDGEPDHDDHSLAASDGSDEVRRSRMMVPRVVRSQLFRIYCERMANEQQQVKQLLFSNHTSSPLLPRTIPRPFRVTVHARRGDRVYHPDGPQSEDGLGWVRATGGDVSSIAALVEALVSEVEACGAANSLPGDADRGLAVACCPPGAPSACTLLSPPRTRALTRPARGCRASHRAR